MERNTRGKYNSQVVKGAMFAIQKQIPDGRKRYTKDFQAALHVEDLAANFAKNGDIYQLQHGLDKVHEDKHHSQQKGNMEGE